MLEKMKELISNYVDNVDGITEDSRLITDIGLSSLDMITLLGDVEEEFSLPRTKEEDIPKIVTVGDMINLIQKEKA